MKTTLLIPTLNELSGMKEIMPQIQREWCDQILIIDGGSTDGTIEYARSHHFEVIQQTKKGLRNAYVEVLDKIQGDIVITFSPDGNSLPHIIPSLITKMKEGYDMIIVSRYLGGAKSEDDDWVTALGNRMFTSMINFIHRARYTDTMVMFRAYKKNIIYTLGLDQDSSYRFVEKLFMTHISWEPLLTIRCAKHKLNIAEIPGDEPLRIGGKRKLQIVRWGLAYMTQIFLEKFNKL